MDPTARSPTDSADHKLINSLQSIYPHSVPLKPTTLPRLASTSMVDLSGLKRSNSANDTSSTSSPTSSLPFPSLKTHAVTQPPSLSSSPKDWAISADSNLDSSSLSYHLKEGILGSPAIPLGSEANWSSRASDGGSTAQGGWRSGTISRVPSLGHLSAGNTIARPDYSEAKIVVAMVGLPARGKSYLSNKLTRYLRWLEYSVQTFNVGQMRRQLNKRRMELYGKKESHDAAFFDSKNPETTRRREKMAEDCLEELIKFLKFGGGNVGIHDATNSSRLRRRKIEERVRQEPGLKLIFIESICTDENIISTNIKHKVSSGDPDYDGMDPAVAEKDFRNRIRHYEESYETIDPDKGERHLTWCKIQDIGHQVTTNKIQTYLQSRVVFYLMNLHITPRTIFFTRHGESQFNLEGKIGGDAPLSYRGEKYAEALPKLVKDIIGDAPLEVWTSTLRRTIQTAENLKYEQKTWKSLDELDAGVCDGMTYAEIEEEYPEDYAARDEDKFNYRYRGGESYRDIVVRLEPVILELERQENILVVCHQAVLRCLYAYFHNLSQDELPYIKIPLHTVIKLTPKAYGCDEKRYTLPIEAVDTTRPKPQKNLEEIRAIKAAAAHVGQDLPPSIRPPAAHRRDSSETVHPRELDGIKFLNIFEGKE